MSHIAPAEPFDHPKDNSVPSLTIIGAGKLGKTLARAWSEGALVSVQQVVNRTKASAEAAVKFIGQGEACSTLSDLKPVDLLLISVSDSQIESITKQLTALEIGWENTTVFHCSGSQSSDLLLSFKHAQASIASVHPLHSFADPASSISQLSNCYCCAEGDAQALPPLAVLFKSIGMRWKTINADQKLVYHAAAVFACNFLPSLMNASHRCLNALNFNPAEINQMLLPLAHQTLLNIDKTSPESALTGPLQRGDLSLLEQQISALQALSPELGTLYKTLSQETLKLTDHQEKSPEIYSTMVKLFNQTSHP